MWSVLFLCSLTVYVCPNNFLEPFEELADEDESPEIAAARRQGKPIVGGRWRRGDV